MPNITVCLASYNGAQYIGEQIESILSELAPADEVIVCDDCSNDSTCSIVSSFNDARIVLVKNEHNLGHVRNYEKALSLAKGRYIFLSDQDDIWEPGKVKKVLGAFQQQDNVKLVYHNLSVIDEHGKERQGVIPQYSGGKRNSMFFIIRQQIRAQIFGCACCIDRSLLDRLLPFPGSVYAHDHWIAVSAAVHGNVYFLSDSLVKHRLHGENLTPRKRLPMRTMLKLRTKLITQIMIAVGRRIFPD
ncbi:MAG: glycosyltransferase family 2 protein [Nitrospirota bacterium]